MSLPDATRSPPVMARSFAERAIAEIRATAAAAFSGANGLSAWAISGMSAKRREGSFSRHFKMTASSPSGTSSRTVRMGGGGSVTTAARIESGVSDVKGGDPLKSSCMMTPSDQMSERVSTVFGFRTCSGDM